MTLLDVSGNLVAGGQRNLVVDGQRNLVVGGQRNLVAILVCQ